MRSPAAVAFYPRRGRRVAAAVLAGVIAVLFAVHQTQVEGARPLIRLFALTMAAGFGALTWYLWQRARRTDAVIEIGPDGVRLALGIRGAVRLGWGQVAGYRYWEPSGLQILFKRRNARWIGFRAADPGMLEGLPWDERLEMGINWLARRPELCLREPELDGDLLEVLEALQRQRRDLDDPMGQVV